MNQSAIVTKDQLVRDLRNIGLEKGDCVSLAVSFKHIGFVDCGPKGFIDAVREVVGSEGTLLANTHTPSFPLSHIDKGFIFDSRTEPLTGLLPKIMLEEKDAVRSRHPTCSIVALGSLANYLTQDHDENARPYLPYEKLALINGKCLFIGTENRLVAIRHEAQRRAGLFCVPKYQGAQYRDRAGKVGLFVWTYPPCMKVLTRLTPRLQKMGMINMGKIGNGPSIIAHANSLLDAMTFLLTHEPERYLCDDPFCVDCREIEYKLKLFGKVEDPLFFQRSFVFRRIAHARNRFFIISNNRLFFVAKNKRQMLRPVDTSEALYRRFTNFLQKITR